METRSLAHEDLDTGQRAHLSSVPVYAHHVNTDLQGQTMLAKPCRTCALFSKGCDVAEFMNTGFAPPGASTVSLRKIKRGEHLFYEGSKCEAIYIVRLGSLKSCLTSHDGCEQILAFHMPGEALGTDAPETMIHGSSAIALEDTLVCVVPMSQYYAHNGRSDHWSKWLYGQVTRDNARHQRRLLMITTMNAEQRVINFLLTLSEQFRARGYSAHEFNLSMSRKDIGNHLCMAGETVARKLRELQNKGLLSVNFRQVRIHDLGSLQGMVGMQKPYRKRI